MSKKRLGYIDMAKGIGIILVVAAHVIGEGNKTFPGSNLLHGYIYSFHMPLFFIISGILLGYSLKTNSISVDYLKKKLRALVRSLLIPYFLWSAIYFILDNSSINKADIYEWILCVVTFRGRAPIWFLGALFWAEAFALVTIFITKQQKKFILPVTAIVGGLSIISWSYCDLARDTSIFLNYCEVSVCRGLVCLFFVLFGYLIAPTIVKNISTVKLLLICGCSLLVSVLCFRVSDLGVNLHTFSISNIPVFFVTGVSGSSTVLLLCKAIYNKLEFNGLERIGQDSMGIMCIHYTHLPFMQYATDLCALFALSGGYAFILSFSLVFVVSFLCTEILKRQSLV